MTPPLLCFEVKESDAMVVFMIRGQLLHQRAPKGHLKSFSVFFLV